MPRQRTVPVLPAKDDRNVILIEPTTPRLPPQERATQRHHSRDLDVKKGRRRHPKHKGNPSE